MRLALVTHRECWRDSSSRSGFSSSEGFPEQVAALAELFDELVVAVPISRQLSPEWAYPIEASRVVIQPLGMPIGRDTLRKLDMLRWLPANMPALDRVVRNCDAVHALMTSDIASFGIAVALLRGKRLSVRHCGNWGHPYSWVDACAQLWLRLLADDTTVVFATGRSAGPPSSENPAMRWIFSTAISEAEMRRREANPWLGGEPLRLVTASRLTAGKNVQVLLHALALMRQTGTDVRLSVAGDGEERGRLESIVAELRLAECVTFHGQMRRDRVLDLMEKSHVFVFATTQEGFPKSLLEAAACGLPCVSSSVSSVPSLVGDDNGTLLLKTTPQTVAEAVLRIQKTPERWPLLSANSKRRASEFSLERWRDEIGQRLESAWGPLRDGAVA